MQPAASFKQARVLSWEKSSVIRTLLYYDIFSYPLRLSEIISFFGAGGYSETIIANLLKELCADGFLSSHGDFYYLSTRSKEVIAKREAGNKRAQYMMQKAYRFSRLISWFPYVRCVCLSGSLSKGYTDDSGDVDYFIMTRPGRLWIARTLLIAYKKVFLLNNRKYFCLNYFIDTNNLEIPDKNLFTATELLTLVPTYNGLLYKELLEANGWARTYFPNHQPIHYNNGFRERKFVMKHLLEFLLNGAVGSKLDNFFMSLTLKRWKKKFGYFSPEVFEQALRTRKYVSKHHPQNFQQKVLTTLAARVSDFEAFHQVQLSLTHG